MADDPPFIQPRNQKQRWPRYPPPPPIYRHDDLAPSPYTPRTQRAGAKGGARSKRPRKPKGLAFSSKREQARSGVGSGAGKGSQDPEYGGGEGSSPRRRWRGPAPPPRGKTPRVIRSVWGGVFAGTPFKGRLFASEWPVLVWASAADSDRLQQSLRIACIVYVSGDGLPVLYAYRSTPLRPKRKSYSSFSKVKVS